MGCNTSQELKTKDNATSTGNGEDHGLNPCESNLESDEQHNINSCGSDKALNAGEGNNERKSSASSMKHHNKADNMLSNGDTLKSSIEEALATATGNGYQAKRDSINEASHDSYAEEGTLS